ncbi:MAG: tetratricopeptide repeat protein [Verrucomicrobia bacterium]|nr:tetratricopeptide repeat protein [Verrucomicrobiota bacterium]
MDTKNDNCTHVGILVSVLMITGGCVGTLVPDEAETIVAETQVAAAAVATMPLDEAIALANRGDFEAAARGFRSILEVHPGMASVWNSLGVMLIQLGDGEAARFAYEKAIQLQPDLIPAYVNLATYMTGNGETNAAVELYYKAVALKPDAPFALRGLARVLDDLVRLDEAADIYRRAITVMPDDVALKNDLATLEASRGNAAQAAELYREILKTVPDDSLVLNNLARILATGDPELLDGAEALRLATRACEVTQWKDSAALTTLYFAHKACDDQESAVATLRQAILAAVDEGNKLHADYLRTLLLNGVVGADVF